ncbi:MAG: matrixin family metalloprotease [Candidatus Bipolaricaulota bacterium]|nr:MAG: matrixin family metalloprotease [Candidatus Bipolaricaulota bacterium]
MLSPKSHRTLGLGISIALTLALLVGSISLSTVGYRVIDEMQQYVNGVLSTIKGRPTWKPGTTIHVYIPVDPQGQGAEKEVQAACKAWEEKLRSETNANLTFTYHVGQPAPPAQDPPPYILEVHWSDEQTTDEPGSATPQTDVTPTGNPNEYQRSSEVKRGDIYINRNQSGGQPYSLNAIYNIALHEFGHIFGLDHKTPDQDSVVMDDRGVDDPNKKHPIKDDDVRGLQDLYGRSDDSEVPEKKPEEDGDGDGEDGGEGTKCCAFECGGIFGCAMVSSQVECDGYDGVLVDGVCEEGSDEDKEQGVYGRCDGGLNPLCEDCRSDLGESHHITPPGSFPAGGQLSFALVIRNRGSMPTRFSVTVEESPWASGGAIELSGDFAPGSEPFDPPPAVTRCIPPEGEVTVTYTATLSPDVPLGDVVTTSFVLEDLFQRELYAFIAQAVVGEADYTAVIPEDVLLCAQLLAWSSGFRHIAHREERWDAREHAPREMCEACGAPMCVVCMEYDLGTYDDRPGVTAQQRSCVRRVESFLRTATWQETEILAAVYWTSYWDGRHNRNQPQL